MLRRFVIVLVLFFAPLTIWAQENLKSVQVAGMGIFQGSGNSGSVALRYDPSYALNEQIKVGASLDWSYHSFDTQTRFSTFSILANLSYQLDEQWSTQASLGAQNWACDGCSTEFAYGAMIKRNVAFESATWISDIFVQYIGVAQKTAAQEILIGLSLQF